MIKGLNADSSKADPDSLWANTIQAAVIRKKPEWFMHDTWRGKLCRFLHSGLVTHTLNLLLVVDIILLIASMQIEVYFLESQVEDYESAYEHHAESLEHYGNHNLLEREEHLKAASIGILSVFAFEICLCAFAEAMVYFQNPLNYLDIVVITVSLYFEVEGENTSGGILVLVRCWRFLRLLHGVFDILEEEDEEKEGEGHGDEEEGGKGGKGTDKNMHGSVDDIPARNALSRLSAEGGSDDEDRPVNKL